MSKFIAVDQKQVQAAMQKHDELLKDDESAQQERRLIEEEAERVKRERDAAHLEEQANRGEGL